MSYLQAEAVQLTLLLLTCRLAVVTKIHRVTRTRVTCCYCPWSVFSVTFVNENENENDKKRENNEFVNEN